MKCLLDHSPLKKERATIKTQSLVEISIQNLFQFIFRIFADAKRLLGRLLTGNVRKSREAHSFKVVSDANNPVIEVTHNREVCIKIYLHLLLPSF